MGVVTPKIFHYPPAAGVEAAVLDNHSKLRMAGAAFALHPDG
jgi:hypothetical protein